LAYRLGSGIAQDCTDVSADSDSRRVTATRPVYGGNAMAKFTFADNDPQVVIMRLKAFEAAAPDSSRTGEVIEFEVSLDESDIKSKLVETVKEESEGVRLEDASVIIGMGRGLGGPEPFSQLEELAKVFNGAVGASRAVCDAGWLDHSYQIGLTGKTVTPDVYITVGISGASQHMAGCSSSKNIVAINKDGDANIFKEASFGVVGDWEKVLPAFTATARELLES
jgi:electron transfer flavoprotein alpha subunit